MSLLPDPQEMLAAAGRIADHADATRRRAEHLAAAVSAADWHGLAANAFHAQARSVIDRLHACADRLDDAADALRRHAHTVAHVIDVLRQIGIHSLHAGEDLFQLLADAAAHPGSLEEDVLELGADTVGVVGDVLDLIGVR